MYVFRQIGAFARLERHVPTLITSRGCAPQARQSRFHDSPEVVVVHQSHRHHHATILILILVQVQGRVEVIVVRAAVTEVGQREALAEVLERTPR